MMGTQTIIKILQADGKIPMRGYKCKIVISKNGTTIGKPQTATTSNAGIINVTSGFGLTIAVIIMKDGKAKQLATFVSSSTVKSTYHEIKAPKVVVKNCKYKDGAIDVAKYILQEIKINTKSTFANELRLLNKIEKGGVFTSVENSARKLEAQRRFYFKIKSNAPWDHKPLIREKFKHIAVIRPLASKQLCRTCYHKYLNSDYFHDVWSNIHYGYVGRSCGFDENTLLSASGKAQIMDSGGSNNDDPIDDKICMKIGMNFYNKFGIYADKLTYQEILDALELDKAELPNSRIIHWCISPLNPDRKK
jgi:hypothetical protein